GRDSSGNPAEKKRTEIPAAGVVGREVNTLLKGSRLTGDINVTCDLELSGDVEGNIRSWNDSNIIITGTCKGSIETVGGSVYIKGELKSGDITAGKDVTIAGRFGGGVVKAKGRIYINGEFNGKMDGNEVDLGPDARGKGELLYREAVSIARGAKVDVQISSADGAGRQENDVTDKKVINLAAPAKQTGGKKQP
ncbi:MAG: polymer-forming cytoskeletal protein, partial [Nitrospiraceae bacterium]